MYLSKFKSYKKNKTINLLLPLLCTILIINLNGCSSIRSSKQDGPPPNPKLIAHIPDAVPKVEPLSKYGNISSYKVFGKQYKTIKSSKNFKQTGTASWYGTKFHGKRTSSGERYDMYGMTGAHKTLPLPTYARVTNKENNKSIIIKINDRGPFYSDRIVDLSYAAAAKLGVLSRGTAKIELTALDPTESINYKEYQANLKPKTNTINKINNYKTAKKQTSQPTRQPIFNNTVMLQIGSFNSKTHAEQLVSKASEIFKHPVKINTYNNAADKPGIYRVHLGPFPEDKIKQIKSKLTSINVLNPITIIKKT